MTARDPERGRRRRRPLRLRPGGRRDPVRPARPGGPPGAGRRRDWAGTTVDGFASAGLGTLAPVEVAEYLGLRPTWVDSTSVGGATWEVMAAHAADAIAAGHANAVLLVYGSTARADIRAGRRTANLAFGARGPLQFEVALRPHPDRQVRDGRPPPHARVRHHDRAAGGGRRPGAGERGAQPGGDVPRPDHGRRRAVRPDDRRPLHQAALLHPLRRRRGGAAGGRGVRARTAARRRCGCWARASTSRTPRCPSGRTSPSPPRRRAGRLAFERAGVRPDEIDFAADLRRVHLHDAGDPRGPGLLREGRGRRRSSRRAGCGSGRRAAGQHRRGRPVGPTPRHARAVPAGGGGTAAARARPGRGRCAAGRRLPRLAVASGTGGWFCSSGTVVLGRE